MIGMMVVNILIAPTSAKAASEEGVATDIPEVPDPAEATDAVMSEESEDAESGDEVISNDDYFGEEEEENPYAVSTVENLIDAESGVVQINCVYVDDDGVSHIIKGVTGFIVGSSEDNSEQYLITSKQGIMPDKDYKKTALRKFGVKKADLDQKLDSISYEVVVTKDISYECSLYKQSDELDLAVFTAGEKLASRKPLSIYTSDDGYTSDLPYGTTDIVYSIGFPDAIDYETNPERYDKKDIVLSTGKIVNVHSLNDRFIITHDSSVDANNCGGPLVNEDGNVIGMNILEGDGIYSVAIDSTELVEVFDSLGIPFNKLTPSTMEPEPEPEETPVKETTIIYANEVSGGDTEDGPSSDSIRTLTILAVIIAILLVVLIAVVIVMIVTRKPLTEEEKQEKSKRKAEKKAEREAKKNAKKQAEEPVRPFKYATDEKVNVNQSGGTGMETNMLNEVRDEGTTVLSNGPIINQPQGVAMNGGTLIRKKTGDNIILCKPETTIGKDSLHVDYCIRDNSAISRVHSAFIVNAQGVYVEDRNSTNGTFVNGVKLNIGEAKILNKGDIIRLANEEFEYRK